MSRLWPPLTAACVTPKKGVPCRLTKFGNSSPVGFPNSNHTSPRALGEFSEARDLAQNAYTSSLAHLGPDHPNTRLLKANLDSLSAPTS